MAGHAGNRQEDSGEANASGDAHGGIALNISLKIIPHELIMDPEAFAGAIS